MVHAAVLIAVIGFAQGREPQQFSGLRIVSEMCGERTNRHR
jgi:hypothetical protein